MSTAVPLPTEPELPDELERAEITQLSHDERLSEVELSDLSLPDQRANGVTLDAARISAVDLSGSRLEHLRIAETI